MKALIASAAIIFTCLSTSAFAQSECDRPSMISVPDGKNSTLDQMLEGQSNVQDFMASMEAYLDCMNEQIEGVEGEEEAAEATRALLVEQYNSGVTEMEAVAAKFNEERIAYQEANPSQ